MPSQRSEKLPPTNDIRCGTYAGYCAHMKRLESACDLCKVANNAHSTTWARNNSVKSKGIKDDWYARNLSKATASAALRSRSPEAKLRKHQYYQDHSTEIKSRTAQWALQHPEEVKEHKVTWNSKNRVHKNQLSRSWKKANPEKVKSMRRKSALRRRANKFNAFREPYTEAEILELYGTDCHICGEPIDMMAPRQSGLPGWELGLHMEHVIPLSKGGSDTKENVKPAHGQCNVLKHNTVKKSTVTETRLG